MPILVFGMNAIAGFVADSMVWGPGYTFTVKNGSGGTLNWHEAAQAWLVSLGASTADASLIYALAAVLFCWTLLWLLWRKPDFLKILTCLALSTGCVPGKSATHGFCPG